MRGCITPVFSYPIVVVSNSLRSSLVARRIEAFHIKVFGETKAAAGKREKRKNKLEPLKAKGKQKLTSSNLKNAALEKHRMRTKSKEAGMSRIESTEAFHDRIRTSLFFGPYSVKEIVLVAEVFTEMVLSLTSVLLRDISYADVEKEREDEGKRAKMALGGKAPLHLFFNDPEITCRPHFLNAVQKMSQREGHKDKGRVNLEMVFRNFFPYMKNKELREALEFVNLEDKASTPAAEDNPYFMAALEKSADPANPLAEEKMEQKLEQLAELFELYDADGNGVVDVEEIKLALTAQTQLSDARSRRGSSIVDIQKKPDEMTDIERIIAKVSKNTSGELNFDQFVALFIDLF